ncbi:hypothetical protein [Streptomyces sp. H39-S7]|uniref:hypothetical protein n=1 Tax=Streptomyces sp. H39-S7 TaxID=3004357 RepID=UPI0022AF6429|nr:hypothetical protein [Streptomyces sp. H39-S7]MCZ4125012.1 hypothetical protein [Streptomyces sp. H39-S7]
MIPLGPLRGRIAQVRDVFGRVLTVAGTGALAAGAFWPHTYSATMTATVVAAGYATVWSATLPKGRALDAAMALYLSSSVSLAALLTTQRIWSGLDWWWDLLGAALWTAVVLKVRPARIAKVLAGREPSLTPAAVETSRELLVEAAPAGPQHPAAAFWAQRVAIEGGAAPNTVLEQVEETGGRSMRAVIRSTLPGKPVPTINLLELSAALNWPEDELQITPVPRQGAGVRRLSVGTAPAEQTDDPYAHWAQNVAPKGMPGTVITSIRAVTIEKELGA